MGERGEETRGLLIRGERAGTTSKSDGRERMEERGDGKVGEGNPSTKKCNE